MKKLYFNILCLLFLLSSTTGHLLAQVNDGGENYYSNPQKGIKPTIPTAYYDSVVVSSSDNITVELTGVVPDSAKTNPDTRKFLYTENPLYWGYCGCCVWDPWYNPWWNGWYYPGWGGGRWTMSYLWGWDPYWGFGFGWGLAYGWGYPWWYGYPYYGAYAWGVDPGYYYGHGSYGRPGHSYLGSTGRGDTSKSFFRGQGAKPSASGRGMTRRGGVDLNRNITRGNGTTMNNRGGNGTTRADGRYNKPAIVTSARSSRQDVNTRGSNGSMRNGNSANSRGIYDRPGYNRDNTNPRNNFDNSNRNTRDTYNRPSTNRGFESTGRSSRPSTFGGSTSRGGGSTTGGRGSMGGRR